MARYTPATTPGPSLWLKWTAAYALVSVAVAVVAFVISPGGLGFLVEWFLFAIASAILQAAILRTYLPREVCVRWAINMFAAAIVASAFSICAFISQYPATLLVYPIYGISTGIAQTLVLQNYVKSPAGRISLSWRWGIDSVMGSLAWLILIFCFVTLLNWDWLDNLLNLAPIDTGNSDLALSLGGILASWLLSTTIYGSLLGLALTRLLREAAMPPEGEHRGLLQGIVENTKRET